mmetsp:Transcript_33320/g.84854  ORF Transcript_33320/g.84854 Transcript_33320/m.84854 type:complete len:275 (-) Transcript_33320:198-1022(-)
MLGSEWRMPVSQQQVGRHAMRPWRDLCCERSPQRRSARTHSEVLWAGFRAGRASTARRSTTSTCMRSRECLGMQTCSRRLEGSFGRCMASTLRIRTPMPPERGAIGSATTAWTTRARSPRTPNSGTCSRTSTQSPRASAPPWHRCSGPRPRGACWRKTRTSSGTARGSWACASPRRDPARNGRTRPLRPWAWATTSPSSATKARNSRRTRSPWRTRCCISFRSTALCSPPCVGATLMRGGMATPTPTTQVARTQAWGGHTCATRILQRPHGQGS